MYINGVKLVAGSDYTTTSSSVITLTENAISGDVVEVVAITETANLVQGFFTANTFSATTFDQVLSSNGVANKIKVYYKCYTCFHGNSFSRSVTNKQWNEFLLRAIWRCIFKFKFVFTEFRY